MRIDDDVADGIEFATTALSAGILRTLLALIERSGSGGLLVGLPNGNAGHPEIIDRKRLVVGARHIFVGEV